MTARIDHIGENHRRAEEDIVFNDYSIVDRYIILNLYSISDNGVVVDKHVLPNVAALPDPTGRHEVGEMPDLGLIADYGAFIYHSGGRKKLINSCSKRDMNVIAHSIRFEENGAIV